MFCPTKPITWPSAGVLQLSGIAAAHAARKRLTERFVERVHRSRMARNRRFGRMFAKLIPGVFLDRDSLDLVE
jgi:hypothetical protein